jgi:phosphoribosylanthranilate isomerase
MMARVKICGITRLEDAIAAIEYGADALGFMFYEGSPRHVSLDVAGDICRGLPPFLTRVGVFVNPSAEFVREAIAACGLDGAQFHGDEPAGFCRQFPVKLIKAFRMRDETALDLLPAYKGMAWLLDSYAPGQLGGTGKQFNWDLARRAVEMNGTVILAGGLTTENVADAVRKVRPFAVDVSSGVESAPGIKNADLLQHFIAAAKGAVPS